MAVRFSGGGLQSYDPYEGKLRKKKKKTSTKKKEEPKKEPKKEPTPKPKKEEGGVFTTAEGRPSGITLPDGRTFFGLSPDEVAEIQRQRGFVGEKALPLISEGAEARAAEEAAAPVLGAAGAFEEVTPKEISLDPTKKFGENVPILGAPTAALQSVLANAADKGWLPGLITKDDKGFPIPITPETLREAALREISEASYKEGISLSESVGTLIEGIPIVGGLAREYAAGLTQVPSGNADDVLKEINKIKEAASTGQEKVRNNLENPVYGLERVRSMEEDLAKLDGRIKILINTSPILRSNSDEVNGIQEQILEAKEKVSRYRNAATFGLTAELTGTGRVVPTDEQLFFELKEINEGK